MDVLIVNSSPRVGGNCDLVTDFIASRFEREGLKVDVIRLREFRISPCTGCRECLTRASCIINDDMKVLIEKLLKCRALIIVTPVYFNNVPSILKAFIDRTWCIRGRLRNKVGAVVVIGRRYGHESAINAVISFYLKHDMIVGTRGIALYAYEKGDVVNDREGLKDVERMVYRVVELLGIVEKGITSLGNLK